jgi:Divergent InlB B-repeat domain
LKRLAAALVLAALGLLGAGFVAPGSASAGTWCGSDESTADRPDLVGGSQIRVMYAIPSDGVDRFAALASPIEYDIAAIDSWWRRQDPTRAPRFDLFAFPGCAPGMGQLDLGFVRLPSPASYYFALSTRLQRLSTDIESTATSNLQNLYKKHLVFYDGVVEFANTCGQGYIIPDQGGRLGYGAVYLQSQPGLPGCGDLGSGQYVAKTAAHELIHTLGALVPGAPHPCPGDPGHPCDDPRDIMYGGYGLYDSLDDYVLDVGHDDYYSHPGSWWDVRNSLWLRHLDTPTFGLTVSMSGAKPADSVASDIPGILCGTVCSTALDSGTAVQLAATPGTLGSRFVRWAGDCKGSGTCAVKMDRAHTVQAVFGPSTYRISVRVTGRGRVTTTSFSCAKSCAKAFPAGQSFRFRASPVKKWRFAGWGGACHGRGTCRVSATAARTVNATFKHVR